MCPPPALISDDCAVVPCARCGGPACAACDYCLGCRRALCARCDTEPTPSFACEQPDNEHPHNPVGWPDPVPPAWPAYTCRVVPPWRGVEGARRPEA